MPRKPRIGDAVLYFDNGRPRPAFITGLMGEESHVNLQVLNDISDPSWHYAARVSMEVMATFMVGSVARRGDTTQNYSCWDYQEE